VLTSRPPRRGVSRRVRLTIRVTLVLALLLTVAGYIALRHSVPGLEPSSCSVTAPGQPVSLNVGQAGIAATIAGVAQKDEMPRRAVTVAYATALQESKLTNPHHGDLDSVGVFQQRPSQGWGPRRQLEDPVYATAKFFAALGRIPDYASLPVYRAAQAVQRSADGYAYNQYATVASRLSKAFTGETAHAVWCWYPEGVGKARLTAARQGLSHAFGPMQAEPFGDPVLAVRTPGGKDGWAVSAWLVSHAGAYGIRHISYDGYQWTTTHASSGWTAVKAGSRAKAPPATVVFG
jgi:hypothetical protein